MKEQRLTWLHGKGRPEIGIIGIATHGIHQCLIDCGELIDTLQHQLRQSHEGLTCIGKEALRLGCTVKRLRDRDGRSEEHTSELQSLMRISYAVFCLKKKKDGHE